VSGDAAFLADFRAGRVPADGFGHREHVRAAWLHLGERPLAEAIACFGAALRAFAAARGKPEIYHETITWAFLLLVNERRARGPAHEDWPSFARRNPDLLAWRPSVLDQYYRPETLASELARRSFVMPDALTRPRRRSPAPSPGRAGRRRPRRSPRSSRPRR
jgi:hypothetical protein